MLYVRRSSVHCKILLKSSYIQVLLPPLTIRELRLLVSGPNRTRVLSIPSALSQSDANTPRI